MLDSPYDYHSAGADVKAIDARLGKKDDKGEERGDSKEEEPREAEAQEENEEKQAKAEMDADGPLGGTAPLGRVARPARRASSKGPDAARTTLRQQVGCS